MRFLTLAFDLFNSRQSFYILCPLRDTDADSLQGFPRYTSLHHPLANVSKSRGEIRYSEGAFFGCTCFSKGGCFPLKSTIPRFDMIGHWERQYREGGLDALSWGSPSRHNKMKKNQSPEATSQSSKNDARSREELLEELNFFRMENADLKKLEVLAQTKKQAAHESERKSCLSWGSNIHSLACSRWPASHAAPFTIRKRRCRCRTSLRVTNGEWAGFSRFIRAVWQPPCHGCDTSGKQADQSQNRATSHGNTAAEVSRPREEVPCLQGRSRSRRAEYPRAPVPSAQSEPEMGNGCDGIQRWRQETLPVASDEPIQRRDRLVRDCQGPPV